MNEIISYIIRFLIGGEKPGELVSLVGYTSDIYKISNYRVVIVPSPFFSDGIYGTDASLPKLPLEEVDGTPLLFGSPKIEWVNDVLVVYADIIASAYFLLTRYEEIRKRNIRDEHGRFPGKQSLPYKAGVLHRPIVDEYGRLLRKWLREARVTKAVDQQPQIKKIWLTHDVDAPFYCRTFRNLCRETLKGSGFFNAWKMFTGELKDDPYYTFPWLLEQGEDLKNVVGRERCESVLFFKDGGTSAFDKPHYHILSKDMQDLLRLCETAHARIGLHCSYDAGMTPSLVVSEKNALEKHTGKKITLNRHHYLASREPEDMDWLEKAGITDDFTIGYADIAGFRLGTSRPVHWINPENRRISPLILHPLTIMDCTLNESNYMGFGYEEALVYALQLIEKVNEFNGEVVLLWHNDAVTTGAKPAVSVDWHRTLFSAIIKELKEE